MNARLSTAIVIAAALFAVGCSDPDPTPAPTTATASSAPTTSAASPTATPLTPEEEATAAAEEVVRAYFETVPRCLADPINTDLSCFDDVATGSELNDSRNSLIAAQQVESTASGSLDVISLERQSVDLAYDLEANPPDAATVILQVCTDVSEFQIVDEDGNSLMSADRNPRVLANMGVLNYEYPDPNGWRVGWVEELAEESC